MSKIVLDLQSVDHDEFISLMRSKNTFSYVLNSMCNAKFAGLIIDVHFIPNKINFRSLPDLMESLDIIDADLLSLLNFVPQGRGLDNLSLLQMSKEEMDEFIKIYYESITRFKTPVRVGIPLDGNNIHKCTAGLGKIDIKFDGSVLPCPAFKEVEPSELFKYGVRDINIYRNLEELEIFNGTRNYPLCKSYYKINSGTL